MDVKGSDGSQKNKEKETVQYSAVMGLCGAKAATSVQRSV